MTRPKTRAMILRLATLAFASLLLAGAAPAQPAAPKPAPAKAAPAAVEHGHEEAKQLDAAKQGLDRIKTSLENRNLSDDQLSNEADAIDPLLTKIQKVIAKSKPRLAALKARLDQLGPPPNPKAVPPPAPEDPAVTRERAEQTRLYTAEDDLLKRAKVLQLRAGQMAAHIVDRRRALFTRAVFQRTSSIFAPRLWLDVARETPRSLTRAREVLDHFAGVVAEMPGRASFSFFLLMVLIAAAAAGAILVARRVVPREREGPAPAELPKAAASLWTAFSLSSIPIAAAGGLYFLALWYGLSDHRLQPLGAALFWGVVRCALSAGFGVAILAPRRPAWRPVDLTDRVARRLMRLVIILAALITLGKIVEAMNEAVGASLQATVAVRGAYALLVGLATARALYGIVGGPEGEADSGSGRPAHLVDEGRWWPPIRFAAWTATFAVIASDLLGYVALSAFIVDQIAWVALIGASLFLLVKLVGAGMERVFHPHSGFGHGLMTSLGMRRESLAQIGALLSALVVTGLAAAAVLLVLAPWGLQSQGMFVWMKSAYFGVEIGGVTLSLSSLTGALLLFAIGYALTQVTKNWLEKRYLPLTQLDASLRAAIAASLGYVGVIASLAFAFAYLGFNTEKLALVAGALSVGVGLGLQSVVNNFVSGLIILWERSIRVGDWIVIGEDEGYVRRINVRATEIETFDRATMIVPNGNMVTQVVKNWVRGDRLGRIKLTVPTVWDADPEKVRDILIDVAKAHPDVAKYPAPAVWFVNFGRPALEFALVCFLDDVNLCVDVKSDLHFAIFRRFAEAGINMRPPSPPQPVTFDPDQVEILARSLADRKKDETK